VRVQTGVLMKVHNSLRPRGGLLIHLPSLIPVQIVLEARGLYYEETLHEPRLVEIGRGCQEAIRTVTQWGLFELAGQVTRQMCEEYDSVGAWVEDRTPFCADLEEQAAIAARLSAMVRGRAHKVEEHWVAEHYLLRKVGRG
jgi:hypothetical protein